VILHLILLFGGILLLYLGAEWLIRGSAELGTRLGVRPIIIGLTIVSVGTSAPELVVCILAVLQDSPELVMGNVLGSNLANVGLILGMAAFLHPLAVAPRVVRRDIPWMLVITLVTVPLFWNLSFGRLEGILLLVILAIYLGLLVPKARVEGEAILKETGERRIETLKDVLVPVGLVAAGSVALVGGGQGIVRGATSLAAELGVPELMVGLSVVAIGTSLPELATTVVAAARKEVDLAVGNIVGSNIFNLTFVLGGTAMVRPFEISERVLMVGLPVTFAVSLLLLPLAIHRHMIGRTKGMILLAGYVAAWVILS